MISICKSEEYLANSRKIISSNKKVKFWHLQNLMKEKLYQPKAFDVVFNRARGINQEVIRLV